MQCNMINLFQCNEVNMIEPVKVLSVGKDAFASTSNRAFNPLEIFRIVLLKKAKT